MNSSLHALAHDMEEPDLGAFLYALRRLPASIWQAHVIVMGQEAEAFARAGIGRIEDWEAVEAPARRRRWYDSGDGTLAVLLASTSDLDDAIPTLVAYQLEWNKLHALLRAAELPEDARSPRTRRGVRRLRGGLDARARVLAGRARRRSSPRSASASSNLRIRMLGGSQSGYARLTRRWWAPVRADADRPGAVRPPDVLRLLQHALAGEPGHARRGRERGRDRRLRRGARARTTWSRSSSASARAAPRARGRTSSTTARGCTTRPSPRTGRRGSAARRHERELGVTHLSSRTGLRVSAQVIELDQARPGGAGLAARADRRRAARALAGRDRQHRVSARAGRLQHPARDRDRARHAARRLRARQGGDAERRRRRRADLRRHPRRALGLDLLARQRVLASTTSRRT